MLRGKVRVGVLVLSIQEVPVNTQRTGAEVVQQIVVPDVSRVGRLDPAFLKGLLKNAGVGLGHARFLWRHQEAEVRQQIAGFEDSLEAPVEVGDDAQRQAQRGAALQSLLAVWEHLLEKLNMF